MYSVQTALAGVPILRQQKLKHTGPCRYGCVCALSSHDIRCSQATLVDDSSRLACAVPVNQKPEVGSGVTRTHAVVEKLSN